MDQNLEDSWALKSFDLFYPNQKGLYTENWITAFKTKKKSWKPKWNLQNVPLDRLLATGIHNNFC